MAVTAPPRPSPGAGRSGSATAAAPPGRVTDHLFRWVALRGGLLVLVDPRADRVLDRPTRRGRGSRHEGLGIFADNWDPAKGQFGAGALIYGTFLVGVIALLIAVPVSVGIALFVTEVAPRRAAAADRLRHRPARRDPVGGLRAVGHRSCSRQPLADIYANDLDGDRAASRCSTTLFGDPSPTGCSFMTAGIIVAIMITPIITVDHARGVRDHARGAEGSGARRWARPAGR